MAFTVDQLQGMRDAIITAIAGGTLRVDFEGRGVTYRTVVEMQAGGGSTSPRQIVITPKGI